MANRDEMTADGSDRELEAIMAEYIRACESGHPPDRQQILQSHPELAVELKQFFAQRDEMARLVEPIRDFADDVFRTVGPGQQISYVGDYELLEEVARGGMGVVYKARQKLLGRIVAVKMMLTGRLANEDDVKRFQIEAQAAASLQHPNIVPIHEVGQHQGLHYFSMDFVDGRSLSAILRENPLSAKQAAIYVRQMAEGIHYAHQQGTLHRDLKPSNILVDNRDQVRITDFGLAMRIERDSDLTRTGQIVGTPSYMPPEQAQGIRSLIGPGSDVYSLGAILYECLTGRAPFRADSAMKTIEQVIHVEAASPRLLNPSIARDLETICLKCLEKEPHRRYGTAQLLANDLQRFLEGRSILARPVGPIEKTWRWCRRKPMVACLSTISLITSAAAVAILISSHILVTSALEDRTNALTKLTGAMSNLEIEEQNSRAALEGRTQAYHKLQIEQLKTKDALERERIAIDDVTAKNNILISQSQELVKRQRTLFRSMLRLAYEQALGNNISLADTNLDRIPQELRGWEWGYAKRLCHPDVLTMPGRGSIGFTLEGKHLVTCIENRVEFHKIPSGDTATSMTGGVAQVYQIAVSPYRPVIASASSDNKIRIWDEVSGQVSATVESPNRVYDIAFSPDRLRLATACGSCVCIWSIDTGELISTALGQSSSLKCIAYSPDGKSLIAGDTNSLRVLDTETGNERIEFKHLIKWSAGLAGDVNVGVHDVVYSPNEKLLAIADADVVRLVDSESYKEVWTFAGHVGGVNSVAFSPDGRQIATASSDGTVKLWDLDTGRNQRTLPWHKGVVQSVAFDPSGRWLGSATDTEFKVWDLSPDWEVVKLPIHTDATYALAFSRDGNLLATGGGRYAFRGKNKAEGTNGEIRVLDLSTDAVIFSEDLDFPFRFGVLAVALNAQGTKVAASGNIGTRVWELKSRQLLLHVTDKDATGEMWSVSFSADDKYLMTSGGRKNTKIWDATTGNLVMKLEGEGFTRFSPDGARVATCNHRLLVCEVADGAQVFAGEIRSEQQPRSAWRLAFSPDGMRIAVCLDTRFVAAHQLGEFAIIVDAKTGTVLQSLKSEIKRDFDKTDYISSVYDVCFSPDGKRIATASGDKTVRIWDAETGDELLILDHPNQVFCVQFSPDGKRLASGSGHWCGPRVGELRIWKAF